MLLRNNSIIGRIAREVHRKQKTGQHHKIDELRNIEYSLLMHLVAIGVGYNADHSTKPHRGSVCWSKGFYLLNDGNADLSSLRELDRQRTFAMKKLRGRLKAMEGTGQIEFRSFSKMERPRQIEFKILSKQETEYEEDLCKKKRKTPFRLDYAGRPFSYYAQFAP
ncbi:hypothetical protein C2W62_43075 [Candidatus Entotheonella serta]|nr:hypothetical protein C2W62_43075 [Candidatus Entotheonella serta]